MQFYVLPKLFAGLSTFLGLIFIHRIHRPSRSIHISYTLAAQLLQHHIIHIFSCFHIINLPTNIPSNAIKPNPLLYCPGADNPAAAAAVDELLVADELGTIVLAELSFSNPAVIVTGRYVFDGMVVVVIMKPPLSTVSTQLVGLALLVLQLAVTSPVFGMLMWALYVPEAALAGPRVTVALLCGPRALLSGKLTRRVVATALASMTEPLKVWEGAMRMRRLVVRTLPVGVGVLETEAGFEAGEDAVVDMIERYFEMEQYRYASLTLIRGGAPRKRVVLRLEVSLWTLGDFGVVMKTQLCGKEK